MISLPRITFGMIVLNGEPFIRYNLRALYPFAHQIIVVEGAAPAAAGIATRDGHSTDGTLETLGDFKIHEDPEDKLVILVAEEEGYPDGFWPGEKDEQSRAYASRATGDYLWQVDVDEFYQPEDMQSVLNMLRRDSEITAVSFRMMTFWGGFDYTVDSWYLRRGAEIYHRLFKWGTGYRYATHRPPTVHDPEGHDLRGLKWVSGYDLARRGVFLYHYSLLFPKQVAEKSVYYANAPWVKRNEAQQWAREVFLELRKPYRVHNVYDYPGWLERFHGMHPPEIEAMRRDVAQGRLDIEVRQTADIERFLRSPFYSLGRNCLKIVDHWDRCWNYGWRYLHTFIRWLLKAVTRAPRNGWRLDERAQ